MEDCLVTKLKGSVEGNLVKLGRFRVTFYGDIPNNSKIQFGLAQGEYVDIIDATFKDGSTRWTSSGYNNYLSTTDLPSSGPFILDFPKYGRFSRFLIDEALGENYHISPITIKDLCGYQTNMWDITVTRVISGSPTITGNLNELGAKCGTDRINFYNQDVEGDISDLYHCYENAGGVTSINLALCPKITGNLKNLLDRIFSLPKYIDLSPSYLSFYIIGSSIDVSDFPNVDRDRSAIRVYSNGDGTYRVENA